MPEAPGSITTVWPGVAVIRSGVAVGESSYTRQALYEYAPRSNAAQDYEALMREVLVDG